MFTTWCNVDGCRTRYKGNDRPKDSYTCNKHKRLKARAPKQKAYAEKDAANKLAAEQAGIMVVEPPA